MPTLWSLPSSAPCAQEHCIISPPNFLAECRKKRLNQASFVLLCFVLFAFSELYLVSVVSVLDLSSVTYLPACTDVDGTVLPNIVLMCR